MVQNPKKRKGIIMSRKSQNGENAALTQSGAEQTGNVLTVLDGFDAQRTQAVESLRNLLNENVANGLRLQQEREAITQRLASFGVVAEEPATDTPTATPTKKRAGRPKGSKNKPKGTVKTQAKGKVGRPAGRPAGQTISVSKIVEDTVARMGGEHTASEIAEVVMKKHPEIQRKSIDSSLQALRGRVVDGKVVGKSRIVVTGEPRAYKYSAPKAA
jgi:hypothetical protein